MTHTVRTTMRPDQEIEVGDADYLDLHRQGLLIEENPAPEPPAAPAQPEKKTPSTAKTS
ncbi:hypothetical protein ACFWPQ_01680 [Streptomyces sp. NPDC058464]|uniref:hypothetical protein n=1 Tax=Streptomyces sp. NPDC058464 TaxID=3346511 RepID=UPI003660FEBD